MSPETRRRVEAVIREQGYRRSDRIAPGGPDHRADLPRAGERVGARDRPRRRARRRPAPPGGRPLRAAGPADARPRLDRGRARAASDRRHRGLLATSASRCGRSSGPAGIPFVVVDPTGEPLHDTPSIGATNWNGGLAATRHLLGLGHRRIAVIGGPARHPVQPRPDGRLPRRDGRGRRRRSTRSWSATGTSRSRRASGRAGPCFAGPTRRPRSSPATTSRRSASTRPPARRGCTSPRTSAWSASTTCRSPAGSGRR